MHELYLRGVVLALDIHHAGSRIVLCEPCADGVRRCLRQVVVIVVVLLHVGNFLHEYAVGGVVEIHLGLDARLLFLHLYHIESLGVSRSLQIVHLIVGHPR